MRSFIISMADQRHPAYIAAETADHEWATDQIHLTTAMVVLSETEIRLDPE